MKHFLTLIICISIGFFGCSDGSATGGDAGDSTSAEPGFNVKNPGKVSDEETTFPVHNWVPGVLKIDTEKVAVNLCLQNGQYIYFITMDKKGDIREKMTEVYNAKQEKVCEIGGPQMVNTCPDFTFDGTKDCHAIFLK